MASANTNTNPTLLDLMKARKPGGGMLQWVEAMSQKNGVTRDAVWLPGNEITGHTVSSRTGLPSIGVRRFNAGVAASKSVTSTFKEAFTMLEGRHQMDVKLVKLNGGAEYRARDQAGFAMSFDNEIERLALYGATATAPDEFNGLIPRLASTTGAFGDQIVLVDDAASGSDQASGLLVAWGEGGVNFRYPPDSDAGFKVTDRGIQTVLDANSLRYEAYESVFNADCGLVVEDGRQMVRLANIDAVGLAAGTTALIEAMITAIHKIGDRSKGNLVFYFNRAVLTFLHLKAISLVANSTLSIEKDLENGKPMVTFMGIPIRMTDELLSTEDVVA